MAELVADSPSDVERRCLNCDSELPGAYCGNCGQSASTRPYTITSIGLEIYEQFRKIDALTTLRTFWRLTVSPGDFVSSYLAGKRVGFLAPIKYFFYSFVVQVIIGGWLFWLTNDHSFENLNHDQFRVEIISFVSTGFWGVLWYFFYRRSALNIVESIVAAIFFVAQVNFFAIILQLLAVPLIQAVLITNNTLSVVDLVVTLAYSFFFARQLFQDKLVLLIPKQLLLSVLFFILVLVIFIVVFASQEILKGNVK